MHPQDLARRLGMRLRHTRIILPEAARIFNYFLRDALALTRPQRNQGQNELCPCLRFLKLRIPSPGGAIANSQGRKPLEKRFKPGSPGGAEVTECKTKSLPPLRGFWFGFRRYQGLATLAIGYRPSGARNEQLQNFRCRLANHRPVSSVRNPGGGARRARRSCSRWLRRSLGSRGRSPLASHRRANR